MVGCALYLASLLLATTSKSPSHPTSHAPSHPTSSSHPTSTHHAHPPSSHPTKAKAPTPTQNKSPSTNNAATQHHTYAKPPPTIRYKPPPPPPHPREHVEELVYVGCYADDVERGLRFDSVWLIDALVVYPAIEFLEAPTEQTFVSVRTRRAGSATSVSPHSVAEQGSPERKPFSATKLRSGALQPQPRMPRAQSPLNP